MKSARFYVIFRFCHWSIFTSCLFCSCLSFILPVLPSRSNVLFVVINTGALFLAWLFASVPSMCARCCFVFFFRFIRNVVVINLNVAKAFGRNTIPFADDISIVRNHSTIWYLIFCCWRLKIEFHRWKHSTFIEELLIQCDYQLSKQVCIGECVTGTWSF